MQMSYKLLLKKLSFSCKIVFFLEWWLTTNPNEIVVECLQLFPTFWFFAPDAPRKNINFYFTPITVISISPLSMLWIEKHDVYENC